MFFQISPVTHKKSKTIPQNKVKDEECNPEILSLGPFTPNPKIIFEDVVIGTSQTRKLQIKNPTSQQIHLFIKKFVSEEINLVLSWNEAKVESGGEVCLEMVWCPTCDIACRQSFTLSDGRKINREVAIIFKSLAPKRVNTTGATNKVKSKNSSIKLPLTRKKTSPGMKLKSQRKTTIKSLSPVKKPPMKFYSPPHKYQREQFQHEVVKDYDIFNVKEAFLYQSGAWKTEKYSFQKNLSPTENKENMSPSHQHLLHNIHGSFSSPSNATFLMDKTENKEHRDTDVLNPLSERRETYTLQVRKTKPLVETKSKDDLNGDTFTFTVENGENSSNFSDSLESSSNSIREQHNQDVATPPLESILDKLNTVRKRQRSPDFEYKLKLTTDKFSFSPFVSPCTNASPNFFLPTGCSTVSNPSSNNKSYESSAVTAMQLFSQNSEIFELTLNSETFTKVNTSSDTYVKSNSSLESYDKCNISSGTYVKDSTSYIDHLEISPVSSRRHETFSPVFLDPKSLDFSVVDSNKYPAESRKKQHLSSIAEESGLFSESLLRCGSKRKSSDLQNYPSKREKISSGIIQNWSKKSSAAFRIGKSTTGLHLEHFSKNNTSVLTESKVKSVIVQNPFLYANLIDPFMTSQIYCNDEWMDQQEMHFKKWLNALLTPPKELNTQTEVDVAKVWQECKKKKVSPAPTKEIISFNFHTNTKLDYLRKQAQSMFRTKEMSDVLQKVCLVVESGKLSIREDKDLHLNLKLKSDITSLLLNYNPLWLRIGLETIYNEIIPLKSNSDTHGLANFILERFLKDPHLIKKHKTVYAPKYTSDLKKFILKKFLILVYFLDRAKNEKLIQHDPCLFCKNATEKESKLVLTHFARETLSAVGDITKYLKCMGYVVTHVQSYIHEFDYAVKNLGVDLRDGVRLARVMEVIQMRNDLTTKLRVPAISRLQKIHNMQLVFKSLEESGYDIKYDISAKDVVDGHKEKTLSFLWQIIYKFEAPLMVKSVTTIQKWFRSLPIVIKRKKIREFREKRENAAKKIQSWYKRQKSAELYLALAKIIREYIRDQKREFASNKIKSFFKMIICRKIYLSQLNAVTKLQSYSKGWLIRNKFRQKILATKIIQKTFRGYVCRKRFLELKNVVIIIQRKFRSKREMREKRNAYNKLKMATICIQRRYRATLEMKRCRDKFSMFRIKAIKIQSFFRMYILRKQFIRIINSIRVIQTRYKAHLVMRRERSYHLTLKNATIYIQRQFRANLKAKERREIFLKQRNSAVRLQSLYRMYVLRKQFLNLRRAVEVIQVRYRAQKVMKEQRSFYFALKQATIFVQQRFRANLKRDEFRKGFLKQKSAAVTIQKNYKMYALRKRYLNLRSAVILIQNKYRAKYAMKRQSFNYLMLKNTTLFIQQRFRANFKMKKSRTEFIALKTATIKIQTFYRMYKCRQQFLKIHSATLVLQRRYRARKIMQKINCKYVALKISTLFIQRIFRANRLKREVRGQYTLLRKLTITIQSYFRMFIAKKQFLLLKNATIKIQRQFRARRAMIEQRTAYHKLKNTSVAIQQKWRARKMYLQQRKNYLDLKRASIVIQQKFKANKQMQIDRQRYTELRSALIKIQVWYRSVLTMRICRERYLIIKKSVFLIEQRYLARKKMLIERTRYRNMKKASVIIQQYYRATIQMKIDRKNFVDLKSATVKIQRRYRSKMLMKMQKSAYNKLKETTVFIQDKFRANRAAKYQRNKYMTQKNAAIKIQQWYKATIKMRTCHIYYKSLKVAVRITESRYKAKKLMEHDRSLFDKLCKASITIQRAYRAVLQMRKARKHFLELKYATIIIQRRYRARKAAMMERVKYQELKNAAICVQRRYRAQKFMKQARVEWEAFKKAALTIQKHFRSKKQMVEARNSYHRLRNSAVIIQRRYRAHKLMTQQLRQYHKLRRVVTFLQYRVRANILAKRERSRYVKLRNSVLIIQQQFRAQILMKIQRTEYIRLKEVTIKVQRTFRASILMRQSREQFIRLKTATLVIQRRYRAQRAMTEQRLYYQTLRKATALVQQKFRANKLAKVQKSEYLQFKNAAMLIQRRYRSRKLMLSYKKEYAKLKRAVLILQCRYRAQKAMRKELSNYHKIKHATLVIQRRFRAKIVGKTVREWYLKVINSVKIIQVHYRAYLSMKRERNLFLSKFKAVIQMQRYARGYLVRKKYSPLLTPEAVEARRILKIQTAAAVKIQATWRGHSVRNSNIREIVFIRKSRETKPNQLSLSMPGRTLAQRCEMAMLCMTSENSSLLMVIRALEDLDFITRHCRDSCVRLSFILPHQLYIIISSAARSLPEMSACNMAAFILINFCKYPRTMQNSWAPEYIDGVINVLLHWCDKEAPLFSTLCTLLWLFGHIKEWKEVILSLPNIQQRFKKIHNLVNRKQNMVIKSSKVNNTSVFGPITGMKLPTRIANWGLDYDRPNTFTNSVFAFFNLMNILEIR